MDPFALLSTGTRFVGKRQQHPQQQQPPRANPVAQPLPELPASGQKGKKTKRKKQGAADGGGQGADEGDGISLFAASEQQQQQQQQQQEQPLPEVRSNDPHEEANLIRKALRIKVRGSDPPPPLRYWSDVARRPKDPQAQQQQQQQQQQPAGALLGRTLLAHLSEHGWDTPTPIQRQAVPALLGGRELLAVAPTGSGKTLAFVLPMLAVLAERKRAGGALWPAAPKALLLSPTHELAAQTARVLKLLLPGSGLRCCLLNRSSAGSSDFSKVDVLVANPLRLKLLAEEGRVDLGQVSYLVLDEVDKLLGMGFAEQVDALLAAASSPGVCRAFFSATLPDKVEELARSVLRDPLHVVVGGRNSAQKLVSQRLLFVGRESGKPLALRQLLSGGIKPPVLVFVSTKVRAQQLHRQLLLDGVRAGCISGDQPNAARAAAVEGFREGGTWVLVATDLVGRGMDFAGVGTVVNYDFPQTTADYIHRIGRTGRAGHAGEAVTLFTEADAPRLRSVAHLAAEAGSEVPDWMLHLAKPDRRKRKESGGADSAAKKARRAEGSGGGGGKRLVQGSDTAARPGTNGGVKKKHGAALAAGAPKKLGGAGAKRAKQQQQQQRRGQGPKKQGAGKKRKAQQAA